MTNPDAYGIAIGTLEFCTPMEALTTAAPSLGTWRLPVLGQPADEAVPGWLLERMISGEIVINSLGGFTTQGITDSRACVAGDVVRLMADGTLDFERPEDAAVH